MMEIVSAEMDVLLLAEESIVVMGLYKQDLENNARETANALIILTRVVLVVV